MLAKATIEKNSPKSAKLKFFARIILNKYASNADNTAKTNITELSKRVFLTYLSMYYRKIKIFINIVKVQSFMAKNRSLLGQMWGFLRERKAYWLIPLIIMLVIVGLLIIFAQSSPISPFIYALF